MSLTAWIILYLGQLVFWVWVIRWGGAERLEGTFASGFLINYFATRWNADGIRLFAWLTLAAGTIWFVIGLFNPLVRF